jgi:flagellar hook-associated protein 2
MSIMRISGIASGLETDTMINDLMRAERLPIERLLQQRQLLQWQQESYRDLNKNLFQLRDQLFDLRLEGNYNLKTATSSKDSVAVTASGAAINGTYEVNVTSLAAKASKASTEGLTPLYNAETGKNLTLYEQFTAELQARGITEGAEQTEISFTLNDKEFTFDVFNSNINSIVSAINVEDIGVKATYDSIHNRFFLSSTETGYQATIKVSDDQFGFLAASTDSGGSPLSSMLKLDIAVGETYRGKDAVFDFDDAKGLTSATNSTTINGVALTFQDEGTARITVSSDIDGVFNRIKDFVDSYNEIVNNINGKLGEKRQRDFPPLTDAQKNDMTEKEIEAWEEKAKSGLFRADSILINLASNMRRVLSDQVKGLDGSFSTLAQIGITTGAWQEGGILHIDEDKLKGALSEDIDSVMQLFTNASDDPSQKGISRRLYDSVAAGIVKITEKAGASSSLSVVDDSFIGERIKNLNNSINLWEDRLIQIENRYWRQFTAMETVMNQMNNQSMWLMQQFFSDF